MTDWFPTIARAGTAIRSNTDRPLDGHNIWNALTSESPSPRDEILYNVNPLCTGGQAGVPKQVYDKITGNCTLLFPC